jgi:hypothetical protein
MKATLHAWVTLLLTGVALSVWGWALVIASNVVLGR